MVLCAAALLCLSPDLTQAACSYDTRLKIALLHDGTNHGNVKAVWWMLRALQNYGFLPKGVIGDDFDYTDAADYARLTQRAAADECISFAPAGSYSLAEEQDLLQKQIAELSERVRSGEVNLIVTLGADAAAALENEERAGKVLALSTGTWFLGRNNSRPDFHVLKLQPLLSPTLSYVHKLGYRSLGVLRDDIHKKANAEYEYLVNFCRDHGITLQICAGKFVQDDAAAGESEFSRCMAEFSVRSPDAVLLSEYEAGINEEHLFSQIQPLLKKRIPLVSVGHDDLVRAGVLMSFNREDHRAEGELYADLLVRLLHGEEITTVVDTVSLPVFLSVNLKTASIVQWLPSFEFMVATDNVYQNIHSN